MFFKIDPRIIRDFPGVSIGVVLAHNIKNGPSPKKVRDLLFAEQKRIRSLLTKDALTKHPHIIPWQEAYKKFGVTSKYVSSIENLVKRIIKGDEIRSINALVDIYNIISLKYLIPAGGEDLDTIQGNIELTYAGAQELAVTLLGEKEARAPEPGEVIYKDAQGAICRRWNWKEADRTKLTPETKNAILVLEGLLPVSKGLIETATNELAWLIEEFCGGTATIAVLDESKADIQLKKNSTYLQLSSKKEIKQVSFETLAAQVHHTEEIEHKPQEVSEEHKIRVEKLEALRAQGIEPWPQNKPTNAFCADVIREFKDGVPSRVYEIAGRVVALRGHGKTLFAQIQDISGKVQIYLKQEDLGANSFELFTKYIDLGDIIWCSGTSFKTKTGEVTLQVKSWELISKCLHPLPEKFHGLADIEIKYRQRYLDLISSPESRERFIKRSEIIRIIRRFFDDAGFIEVETPMLHPIPGGAEAKPFITHHNALDMDLYLRIAPELYLKRLIIGGFERVYEINRLFRNEGLSTKHNPEFTSVEWYIAYHDYVWMMDFVEQLLRAVVKGVCPSPQVPFGELVIDFESPFKRMTMFDAVLLYGKFKSEELVGAAIDTALKKHAITLEKKNASWGEKLYALFDKLVEPQLIQPTFITQFPVEVSPLAKRNPTNPDFVDRFELFIAGMEMSNAFNELNDPFDQAERFKEQAKARAAGHEEAHFYDADYVLALEYGLPPTVGAAIGIDRLTMLLTNTTSIRDVILFPTLKRK